MPSITFVIYCSSHQKMYEYPDTVWQKKFKFKKPNNLNCSNEFSTFKNLNSYVVQSMFEGVPELKFFCEKILHPQKSRIQLGHCLFLSKSLKPLKGDYLFCWLLLHTFRCQSDLQKSAWSKAASNHCPLLPPSPFYLTESLFLKKEHFLT
jgi:hypothetical protein